MTSTLDSRSRGDRARSRAYLREFVIGIAAYVVALAVSTLALPAAAGGWRVFWAVLPALPVAWIGIAVARHLRRIDEYQRGRLLEGLAVGFVVAMLAAVTLGLLEAAGLRLQGTGWWIYSAGMLAWLVAGVARRR